MVQYKTLDLYGFIFFIWPRPCNIGLNLNLLCWALRPKFWPDLASVQKILTLVSV